MNTTKGTKPDPNLPHGRFKEESQDYTYLRDVAYLLATERRQKRIVLSGEIISSVEDLRSVLKQKLGMQSTNVRKAFRKLDQDYSGELDRMEFKRFLENLNIHCTISAFNGAFALLDRDNSGTVEFGEFMSEFGPAIAGAELPVMLDGEARMAKRFEELVRLRELRAGSALFSAEQARVKLTEKLATMSSSVRKIFAHANSDYQREGEKEGGLSSEEFKQLLFKFNIPMSDAEYDRLYSMLDPDGSGVITYPEFQREFGESISGSQTGQAIRWGATAVPNHHKFAKEWSELASFADVCSSGPDVQSGGSVVTDEVNEKGGGFLVQKATTVMARHASEDEGFEFEAQVEKALKEVMRKNPGIPRSEWDDFIHKERQKIAKEIEEGGAPKEEVKVQVPVLPVADMVAKAASGAKLTKSEFLLQRRQLRDQTKMAEYKPRFGSGGGVHAGGTFGSPVSDRSHGTGLSSMRSGYSGGSSSRRQLGGSGQLSSSSSRQPSARGGGMRSGRRSGGSNTPSEGGGAGQPPASSRSVQVAQATPQAIRQPQESVARMRDALDRAVTTANRTSRRNQALQTAGSDIMVSPVTAPGALPGERPGLVSSSSTWN